MLPDGATLERITGVDDDGGTVVTTVDDLLERASTGHAELRVLQSRITQAQAEGDVALRGRLPSPIVSGGLKRSDNDSLRETGGVVGVGVIIPLFDRGGRDAARWEAERLSTEAERVAIERRVRADILAAHQTLQARRAAADQDRASNPEELMQIAEVAYREGEIGILELLDAVRTVVRARVRSLEITHDVRLAAIELERAMGGAPWP
jgi:cobalt-zinc-cadmium efflux system outer membrane protein